MVDLTYTISPDIFRLYPGYIRGVVIAREVHNGPSPQGLIYLLRQAEAHLRTWLSLEDLTGEPRIAAWREAFRKFGAKPGEFRCSVEAMARRVLRNEPLPAINALVDIGNLLSLRHLAPVGGHAIDHLAGDLALCLATGTEEFIPFGGTQMEHPLPGEVIFAEGDTVLTRRWTWRQGNHTLTLPSTTAIEFNVDGLPPLTPAQVEQACADTVQLVQEFCGGSLRVELLSQGSPSLKLFN